MKKRKKMHNDWGTLDHVKKGCADLVGIPVEQFQDPCPLGGKDGLNSQWELGKWAFVNPPYDKKGKEAFVRKGLAELRRGIPSVFLLPVSTSTELFHEVIVPNASKIYFVRKRIKFIGLDSEGNPAKGVGMHDSMVVIFHPNTLEWGKHNIVDTIEF